MFIFQIRRETQWDVFYIVPIFIYNVCLAFVLSLIINGVHDIMVIARITRKNIKNQELDDLWW